MGFGPTHLVRKHPRQDRGRLGDGPCHDQPVNTVYRFDGNETQSPRIITLSIWANSYNVITEFYMIDVESPPPQHYLWEALDPHDEGHPIKLPPSPAMPHSDRKRGHSAPSAHLPGRNQIGCQRLPMWPPMVIPLWRRSESKLQIYNNHKMAKP